MKFMILSLSVISALSVSLATADTHLPSGYALMRECQRAGENASEPFQFFDQVRARKDLDRSSKEGCIEWTIVRNRHFEIAPDQIDSFEKALLDPTNQNISSRQIFKIITGR